MVAERLFGWSSNETTYSRHGQPASGLSQRQSGVHPWRQSRQEAAVPVGAWQMATAPRWCIKSDNGHCQARQSCQCSMLAAEVSGLNWMTKPSWTAILCYRKASCAMFSHRNALLHGRALQVNDSRSLLCCRAVKMLMTGLTSCCRKRTYGPPLQLGELSQRGDFRADLS